MYHSFILYTDKQLTDLQNFCSKGHTVLRVDKMFNLRDMHVMVTCYKQFSLNKQWTDGHPIFLGQLYLETTVTSSPTATSSITCNSSTRQFSNRQ